MLLVSFIGAPCSGKTTTMLKLSAKLKEGGIPLEYVGEYAREYIHRKKALLKRDGKLFDPSLTDDEQWHIMSSQFAREDNAVESIQHLPDGVVISDGSPLNSMLYMTPEMRTSQKVKDLVRQIVKKRESLLFYNHLFDDPTYVGTADPNRIHSRKEQQRAIDELIPEMMKEWGAQNYITLVGGKESRLARAYQGVYGRIKYLLDERARQEEKEAQQVSA